MTYSLSLTLYGPPAAFEKAKGLLENLPQVRSIDCMDSGQIKLFVSEPLYENSLIPLLAQSGISGFRLNNDQKFSRNGSPLSL